MTQGPYGAPRGAANIAPRCKNHPDRATYVVCQRCGQPICPECSVSAAVGMQCRDCVQQGASEVRVKRTVAGATVVAGQRPIVTMTMMGLCVIGFVLQMALGWQDFTSKFVFAPIVGEHEPWRFLTSAFLHSTTSFFHIVFNLWALWVVGPQLELLLGRWRFTALYLLSALGGTVAILLLATPTDASWVTATLGASGAVFGLFGALLPIVKRLGGQSRSILMVIGLNVVVSFIVPNISWQGHLGGLLVGALLGYIYIQAPRDKKFTLGLVATIGVALGLIVAVLVKYASVGF